MEKDHNPIKDKSTILKDWIKSCIFNYIDDEIIDIKEDIKFNLKINKIMDIKTIKN